MKKNRIAAGILAIACGFCISGCGDTGESSSAVSEATTCQKVTFDLDDKYAGKVVYIGIRHKYSAEGYTLLIHYVDATALFEPIA